jgi:hypothetical protein
LKRRGSILLSVLLAASAAANDGPWRFPTIDTPDGPLYVISGKEHPEAIPYWVIWNGEFQYIAMRKENPTWFEAVYGSRYPLSADDWLHVYAAGDGQVRRDADCKVRYLAWEAEALKRRGLTDRTVLYRPLTETNKRDPLVKELGEKQMAVAVACRADDLAAADDLMAKLSPAGRKTMMEWIDWSRRGTTSYEHPNRMKWYYQPEWQWVKK